MDASVELWEIPSGKPIVMIAGWQQWADAGEISSSLPLYLVEQTDANKIGTIKGGDFYLFQIPGTHYLLRPEVKLKEGYRQSMSSRANDFYYADLGERGLVIFAGEEPHMHEETYARAFFDAVESLNVQRVIGLGGVFGSMPYDRDREISCVYSMPHMKAELDHYAVRYSNYEGGTTIGSYLAHCAELRAIEMAVVYAFVPAYEFSAMSVSVQSLRIDKDWKAWYDIMKRLDHMLELHLDLSDLEDTAGRLVAEWTKRVAELDEEHPTLHIREALDAINKDFVERPFIPLDEAWDELGDLLDGMDSDE